MYLIRNDQWNVNLKANETNFKTKTGDSAGILEEESCTFHRN